MLYHHALARALWESGTNTVFGVLGDANLFAIDSFRREFGGRFVSMSHEGGAVLAAAGYSATSPGLGVATVTHGPALTNTVTALVDAARSRTPLLLIAGDTDPADQENLQNIDQHAVVAPTGAGWEPARRPETVAEDLERAARRALAERRPVVLDIPVGFQWADLATPPRSLGALTDYRPAATGVPIESIDAAAGLLAAARRPIVLAGRGALGARAELEHLAAVLGAPVATTLRGKGLFRGNPHDIGIFGTLSHDVALEVIQRADTVIAFGAGLTAWTTDKGALLENRRVVRVDTDPANLAFRPAVDVSVWGDAATVARALTAALGETGTAPTGFASAELGQALRDRAARQRQTPPVTGIDLVCALRTIDDEFDRERTLVIDDGRFIITGFRELSAPDPAAYVHTCSFASIGLAVASAVGAQIGRPQRPVLVVCGDGGFMSAGINELSTAVRHGVDMVVVVVNDNAYGAEYMQFRTRSMDPAISTFDWPSFAAIAEAVGAIGIEVVDHRGLDHALRMVAERDRPVLIDLRVDPDNVPTPGY
ncbi:thiamine pyrophosphate-binding protein [Nocardia flavorosea]|uniref:acetolactate synthase n=1 Tax=Nocardia flavorosea TaxID=53429 RepID=A0A846YEN0_9NOCA|nr:thiamine pyrophosphate-dependent enzyme [Nocardia flavorosea]NKY57317.1 thiamine pyrophosphate-binding protein [Nocardia flavorosea]